MEILFQKVASGYLLHFVQDGSSKNALDNLLLHTNVTNIKLGNRNPYIFTPELPINRPFKAAIYVM